MKRTIVMPVIMVILGLSQTARASNDCVFPNSDKAAPEWVCDAPVEGVSVGAVGSGVKSGAGISFMKQMAVTDARAQLAQHMKVHVENMVKQYAETTGAATREAVDKVVSVTKQIADQTLQKTKIFRSIVAPDGTMYVLVGLDDAAVQKLTEAAVKASMKNDAALWQKFKAGKSSRRAG